MYWCFWCDCRSCLQTDLPALQRLAKRGKLNWPVIDVAKARWMLDQ
jgi:hypothetical protein